METDLPNSTDALVRWTVRIALGFYAAALIFRSQGVQPKWTRAVWTVGWLIFLAHLAAAFHFVHGWSHRSAYEETARRSYAVVGLAWGEGIYANHAFTVVWGIDVLWWWLRPAGYLRRPRWIEAAIQGYFAFIAFNATVVFGHGWIRWAGAIAAVVVLAFSWSAGRSGAPASDSGSSGR